jgi:hypothetical protein
MVWEAVQKPLQNQRITEILVGPAGLHQSTEINSLLKSLGGI